MSEHQGVDSASGRRRRTNLADKWGLLVVHHRCSVSGAWTISLMQPSVALAEALGLVPGEAQGRLPFTQSPADQATSESSHDGAGDAPAWSAQPRAGSAEPLTEPPTPNFADGGTAARARAIRSSETIGI
jgi:hypothetical protein